MAIFEQKTVAIDKEIGYTENVTINNWRVPK
jgi:hypothetical protein